MKNSWIAVIAALALLTVGFAAPALAHGPSDDRGRGGHGERGPDHEERKEARDQRHDEMKEARENFTRTMRDAAKGHRDCAEAARGDNNTTENATRDCHHAARDAAKATRVDAREHFLEAKKRAQEKYRDALQAARDSFLENRTAAGCEASDRCISKQIANLEARKARAQSLHAMFEEKLAAHNNTTDENATDENATGPRHAFETKLLRIEQQIERIDARLAHWYALQTDISDEPEDSTGNTTAEPEGESIEEESGSGNETA